MCRFRIEWKGIQALLLFLCLSAAGQINVLTYHNNRSRTGENLKETRLTPANVNPATFGKLFSYSVDGHVYAQPLYMSGLRMPGLGIHNVIFVRNGEFAQKD